MKNLETADTEITFYGFEVIFNATEYVLIFVKKKTARCLSVRILPVRILFGIFEKALSVVCVSGWTRTRQTCPDFRCRCAVTLFNFRDNFPSSFKLSNFGQNFPTTTKLSNFSEIFKLRKIFSNFAQFFPTSLSSLQFCLALSNLNRNFPTLDFPS